MSSAVFFVLAFYGLFDICFRIANFCPFIHLFSFPSLCTIALSVHSRFQLFFLEVKLHYAKSCDILFDISYPCRNMHIAV